MALTEEQKERIRVNREKALEIQRRKKEERLAADRKRELEGRLPVVAAAVVDASDSPAKRRKTNDGSCGSAGIEVETKGKDSEDSRKREDAAYESDLEEFEMGAPSLVSKGDAMRLYCLPEGTLAVCSYVEKENPRRKTWTPMKLYERSELRRRARERYGGREGLIAERRKREERKLAKDLRNTADLFKR